MTEFLHQPDSTIRLGDFLKSHLQQTEWTSFRAAIAFVKQTGVRHIAPVLASFSSRAQVKITVGVDQNGTSSNGLVSLLDALDGNGEVWVFHNENQSTFHPKVYMFSNEEWVDVVVGSGNLTEGGLFTNYEAAIITRLHLTEEVDRALFDQIQTILNAWADSTAPTARLLTRDFLQELMDNGYALPEGHYQTRESQRPADGPENASDAENQPERSMLFPRVAVRRPPSFPRHPAEQDFADEVSDENFDFEPPTPILPQPGTFSGFVMTLQRTDVGVGQTTAGASRRSPEIFIPLSARNYDPDFWGWPSLFTEDNRRAGKFDRTGVQMRVGTQIVNVNMMIWPVKHDFRLRSEALRSAGNINDILRIERVDGSQGYSYYVEVIPFGTTVYLEYMNMCVNETQNSRKMWGYY